MMEENSLWYKDAVLYELHVRAFFDSNDDGVGDFRGLIQKLDYLQDLGITALWLLPFYPSPLRDDGYDIADYTGVHAAYGDLRDVRQLVREAHRRGLRVITELVCNHTSDQHSWFQTARRAKPGSPARDFYVWSDAPDKYLDARIIFKDFETSNWAWDPVANAYYWHRFYSHQPDLNFDNRRVQQAIFRAMDFWLQMGVDGLRLDAIPYLYEREGTNCENLPETHAFLRQLRAHVDEHFRDRMLLAEANQWPEDSVAYFGNGDECHMAFHFPVMPRLFMAIQMEDRFPIEDILAQTPPIPESAQWAMFLRNHDELTLEMVTDEERDYMYRVYAHDVQARINLGIRRRLAPLLGNNRRRIELMNVLLCSLPGTPVIYYGDEIGMGDNIYLGDRNGVRTPMQWSPDRNAGFSKASSQRLYFPVITEAEYHYVAVNVESQQQNHQSLLWWMKRLIALRKEHLAFGRGSLEFLHPDNRKTLAFVREYQGEQLLIVANLSRFPQYTELDLGRWSGCTPIELFGGSEFPTISELPYVITLGPNSYYWFRLAVQSAAAAVSAAGAERLIRTVAVDGHWDTLLEDEPADAFADALTSFLRASAWFKGKDRQVQRLAIQDHLPLPQAPETYLTLLQVRYVGGDAETYLLPLACATGEQAENLLAERRQAVVARLRLPGKAREAVLYDATIEPAFWGGVLRFMRGRHRTRGVSGELLAESSRMLRRALNGPNAATVPLVTREGTAPSQDVATATYGETVALKLMRRVEAGINPEVEIARYLTERQFAHTPALAGVVQYQPEDGEPTVLAILSDQASNQTPGWQYMLDTLGRYFEHAAASAAPEPETNLWQAFSAAAYAALPAPDPAGPGQELLGPAVESTRLLGQRSAQLHAVLAAATDVPALAPEPFTTLYQRSLYQSMRSQATSVFQTLRRGQLRKRLPLPDSAAEDLDAVLSMEAAAIERYQALVGRKLAALRIRCHGEYDLNHVLYTGKDFVIVDVEADQSRPPSERRIKRSPLRDVTSMLWSFHCASYFLLFDLAPGAVVRTADVAALEPWARYWRAHVSSTFVQSYLAIAAPAVFLPPGLADQCMLLDAYLLEHALLELRRSLDSAPQWAPLILRGLRQILESG